MVTGVPNNVHESHKYHEEAEEVFATAFAAGKVQVIKP
jgi:hypothetical protein